MLCGWVCSISFNHALTRIIQWLLLSLLFSIIIEWAGRLFWWPDECLEHSRAMLSREIGYLYTDFRRSVITSDPAWFAKRVADNTYHYLFEVTRLVDFIRWITPAPRLGETGLRPTLHKYYRPSAEFVIAMMQITQLFSVRLAILILAKPVFLLFSLLALVDGLVQRDLRRWGGGRESSFVYHYAKKAALPLTDIKPRVLTTAIDLDDGSASLDLAMSVLGYFELDEDKAHAIAAEVGQAVTTWREESARLGMTQAEINRMASALEHEDLKAALLLS